MGRTGAIPSGRRPLADAVGLAPLVVLDRLNPAERITFVLHDTFGIPFTEIAPIVGKSEAAVRQLATRARRRIQGAGTAAEGNLARRRQLVDAFIAAAQAGDFDALIAALDPDVVLRDDRKTAAADVTRGARALAGQISGRANKAQSALVNGSIGAIVAPRGRLLYVLQFTIKHGRIAEVDLISDPARIRRLDLAVFRD
ncbi:hypothetical protein LJK87_42740 [Paenibacillus sp. P25]|nr:hypothetical protein LJK87_42740 [Paenibacillus sp. P25]